MAVLEFCFIGITTAKEHVTILNCLKIFGEVEFVFQDVKGYEDIIDSPLRTQIDASDRVIKRILSRFCAYSGSQKISLCSGPEKSQFLRFYAAKCQSWVSS